MKSYAIWFQDSHTICIIPAENNGEARKTFNRMINVRQLKDDNCVKGEQNE